MKCSSEKARAGMEEIGVKLQKSSIDDDVNSMGVRNVKL